MKKILFVLMSVFMFFSCGTSNTNSNENVITYNLEHEGISLDPQILTDSSGMNIHGLVSEGLTYTLASGKVKPALAESWEVSEDGLTWTFKLRDNIKWSNGEEITADDFVFGWERALDPNTASEYSYILFPIKNAEKYTLGEVKFDEVGVKALDDKTLEVKLENVTSYFDSLVSFVTYMPANRKFVEEKGAEYGLEPETLLYSGPYKIVKWDHNTQIKLERNEYYYDSDSRKIDGFVIKFIADSTAALNAFKNGEIDIVSITTEQLQEFKDDTRLRKDVIARTYYLPFNMGREIFKNQKIREAISLAIDKEGLIETVFNNSKEASYTFTPKNSGMIGIKEDFVKELGKTFKKYDSKRAKDLFEEGKKEMGIADFPVITLVANDGRSNKKVVEKIQEDLRVNLGLELNVEMVTFKERLNRMKSKEFDILLTGWGADYQDPVTFLDLLMTNNGNNTSGYSSAEYDNLIISALKTINREKRMNYLFEAERLIARDVPVIPLFQDTKLHLINDKVKGVEIGAFGIDVHFNNAEKLK